MSLNGLDVNAVAEAHQSALADAGGWFLLKYANRDTVELLSYGTGSVAEAKGVVEQYAEKSPLYGMVQYRRKRVLLKYVPEGMSRLLQVRTAVQFQSVLDAFPHDTIFSFSVATELVESALGLCTMLQPANGESLRSSDSSVRQRRLNEISEDAEDSNMPADGGKPFSAQQEPEKETIVSDNNSDLSTLPASALRAKALLAKRKEESLAASLANNTTTPTPLLLSATLSVPNFDDLQPRTDDLPAGNPLSSLDQLRLRDETKSTSHKDEARAQERQPTHYHHSRHLSENESNTISQWNEQVAEYTLPAPQPKKKLAPKPHVDSIVRPRTASQYGDGVSNRPVSNLPNSVRVSNRGDANFLVRPGSQQSTRSVPTRFLPSPNLPPLPDFDRLQPPYLRPNSRHAGSVTSSIGADIPAASPEKMRLMKALQNRKRSQLLAQRAASAQSSFTASGSRGDFPLGTPIVAQTQSPSTIPTTIREEGLTTVPVKTTNDSSTASPTSLATTSNGPSTRPSSFVEERKSQSSQVSLSHDTDSSSTPKAGPARPVTKKHMSWFDSAPDLDEESKASAVAPPVVLQGDREEQQIEKTDLPLEDETESERPISRRQDRAALSWLANDSELNIVRSLMQAVEEEPEPKKQSPPLLNVDTFVQSGAEESSLSEDEDSEPEEIHVATVHQATPVSVSRPPLTPTMRTVSHDRSKTTTKSSISFSLSPQSNISTPSVRNKSPGNSLDNFSTALPQLPPGSDRDPISVPLSKKTTLGQGISKRIKALEDSSRRDSGISSSPPAHESSASRLTFSNIMKRTSFISQTQTPDISIEKPPPRETSKPSLASPPITDSYRLSRPWNPYQDSMFEPSRSTSDVDGLAASSRTSYDRSSAGPPPSRSHEPERQSLLTPLPLPPLLPDLDGTPFETTTPSSEKKRFSFTSYRSGNSYRSTSTAKWLQAESLASRTSLGKDYRNSRPTTSETSSITNEKRGSRASRLMKRLSGFGSRSATKGPQHMPSREDFRPDPIMEQNENFVRPGSVAESVMQVIDIGNVNVQFPETLLWKRRFLRVDDQGYLIFSAPTENANARSTQRKFHLADIQEPCLPDSERQEMAWSVLLDLRDGNCIQCACESKQAQGQVLKMLLDAHAAFHSLYADPSLE